MNLPIDSAKFEFIRQKKEQVNLLLTQAQTAQQQQQHQQQQDDSNGNNDLLQFFQRDSFTGFVTSLLQVVVVQHRNVLLTNGLSQQSDADLYQLDPITNEYSVTPDGVQKMASLLNFDAQSKQIKDPKNKNVILYTEHFVHFKILIKPAQCVGAQSIVNDTTWMHMLEDIHMVATYLDSNDITFGNGNDAGKNGTTPTPPTDLIQVEDPDCQGQYCIDHSKKSNGASGILSQSVFVMMIVVFTILSLFIL